jgi:hypothetical protein
LVKVDFYLAKSFFQSRHLLTFISSNFLQFLISALLTPKLPNHRCLLLIDNLPATTKLLPMECDTFAVTGTFFLSGGCPAKSNNN